MRTAYWPLLGRLGNLMFIYAHARAWCEQEGYELCMDPWIGEKIFTIHEANRTRNADKVFPEAYYQDQASIIYTRKQVREWFTFKPEILERLKPVRSLAFPVLLNIRRGSDHLGADHVCISPESYRDAAKLLGYDVDVLNWVKTWDYEFDTSPTRLPEFSGDPNSCGLGTSIVSLPSFYRLMTAKVLFRANSTFSFWAATLNTEGKIYSPVIQGLKGGVPDTYCPNFVEGNWPQMTKSPVNTDLHLPE